MKTICILLITIVIASANSQIGYSPVIDSVKNQCTIQTLSLLDRQLSGDTSCMIGGAPYTIASRYWGNIGNMMASQFIFEKFKSYGLDAHFMIFSETGTNVYAVKTGTKYPNKKFIICSHYDDMPTGSPSPGADDNASGTCAVLEAARLLAPYQFDYTLVFIAFDEEERGSFGSLAFSDSAYNRGDSILFVFNYDMLGWDSNNDGELELIANTSSLTATDNTKLVYNLYLPQLSPLRVLNNNWSGSDNWYFWQNGFKALCGIESLSDFNPHLHTVNDKFQYINMGFFLPFTQAAIAALMTFAWDCFMNIVHSPIESTGNTTPQTASVIIRSPKPVAGALNSPRLYFKVNSGSFDFINPYYNHLDTFLFQIPGQPSGSAVYYYIAAQDSAGRFVATLPDGGRGISPPGTTPPVTLFAYSITTGIAQNNEPVKFEVEQNFPNPFNSTTNIRMYLPESMHTEMIITDVLGRVVQKPVDAVLPRGENIVMVDAKDLSSGIYFYTVSGDGNLLETKKMILIK